MSDASMPPTLAPGTIVGGRYRIDAFIGAGTMGAVHRATRVADERVVALKLIPPRDDGGKLAKRLEREGRALAALTHPHILSVLDLGTDEHGSWLVTELAVGTSLDAILHSHRLTPEVALHLAQQILAALAHAHAMGIIHRDVKAANVVVGTDAQGYAYAKLLDFGLAKFHDRETWGPQSALTMQGAILGTPAYLAPEQVFGPGGDARSDVYSAGVLLFELLTGSWPFVHAEIVDMLRAHALDRPPTLAATRPDVGFHPELEAVVAKALAKKPQDRFADAQELRAALHAVPRPAAWSIR